jgi:hypothetical protein
VFQVNHSKAKATYLLELRDIFVWHLPCTHIYNDNEVCEKELCIQHSDRSCQHMGRRILYFHKLCCDRSLNSEYIRVYSLGKDHQNSLSCKHMILHHRAHYKERLHHKGRDCMDDKFLSDVLRISCRKSWKYKRICKERKREKLH